MSFVVEGERVAIFYNRKYFIKNLSRSIFRLRSHELKKVIIHAKCNENEVDYHH